MDHCMPEVEQKKKKKKKGCRNIVNIVIVFLKSFVTEQNLPVEESTKDGLAEDPLRFARTAQTLALAVYTDHISTE